MSNSFPCLLFNMLQKMLNGNYPSVSACVFTISGTCTFSQHILSALDTHQIYMYSWSVHCWGDRKQALTYVYWLKNKWFLGKGLLGFRTITFWGMLVSRHWGMFHGKHYGVTSENVWQVQEQETQCKRLWSGFSWMGIKCSAPVEYVGKMVIMQEGATVVGKTGRQIKEAQTEDI